MKRSILLILPMLFLLAITATSCKKNCAKCLLVKVCEGDQYDDGTGEREMNSDDIQALIDSGICSDS